ncbi:MAG: glycosyltransferase family 2 protein [Pseudomonadota bacterium]
MPLPISCTIITKNEGDRIGRTILSTRGLVDEVVVVDSGSTDDTVAVCEDLGARVIHNPWPGYGPQKRFAEDQAQHDWILNLDADEVLSDRLQGAIKDLKDKAPPPLKGYRFRQVTVYPGQDSPRPLADFHHYVRLYDRRAMRFRDSLVHDVVDVGRQPVGDLPGGALHYSFRSLDHLARKLDSYTSLQAKEIKKPRWQLRLRQPFEYGLLFLRYAILRRHLTGGLYGVKVAHTMAKGRSARIDKFLAAPSSKER